MVVLDQENKIRKQFKNFDHNNDGNMDREEIKQAMRSHYGMDVSDDDLNIIIDKLDDDQSGSIDETEWLSILNEKKLRELFNEIDADRSGFLTFDEVVLALRRVNLDVIESTIRTMLDIADKDGSGTVSFEEFSDVLCGAPTVDLKSTIALWVGLSGTFNGSELGWEAPPTNMSYLRFILAGGTSGIVTRTLLAPFERVVIRAQTGRSSVESTVSAFGWLKDFNHIVKSEGVLSLWRGNLVNCLRVFPGTAVSCLTYGGLKTFMPGKSIQEDWRRPALHFTAGLLAGTLATTFTFPLDVIHARLAANSGTSSNNNNNNSSSSSKYSTIRSKDNQINNISKRVTIRGLLRNIIREEGLSGLYKGIRPTIIATASFMSIMQLSYDIYKDFGLKIDQDYFSKVSILSICGISAGITGQVCVYPIDLIRRRRQVSTTTNTSNINQTHRQQLSIWKEIQYTFRRHGLGSLYAGIVPTLIRTSPSVAISLVVRDAVLDMV